MKSLPQPAAPRVAYFAAFAAALLLLTVPQAFADDNSFILSRNADLSTQDRNFRDGDSIYVLIKAPELDPAGVTGNRFLIHSIDGMAVWRGEFENHLDGSFTTTIAARQFVEGVAAYQWSARLEDAAGNEFAARTAIRIGEDSRPPEFFLKGEIEALGDTHLVVKGRKVLVTDETHIFGPNGSPIVFGRLQVGHHVEVAAVQRAAGLTAIVIRLVDQDEVHIGGAIERLSTADSVLVVRNVVVFVVPDTEIVNPDGETIEFSSLQIGQLVRVAGTKTDGGVVARLIAVTIVSPPTRFELEGRVVETSRAGITIDIADIAWPVPTPRLFIAVNAATEIRDAGGNELGLADISPGDHVKVAGKFDDNGTATATEIVVLGSLAGHVELKGPIAEIGDRLFRIGPFVFHVDEHTVLVGRDGQPIEFSDLEIGMMAKVFAEIDHDGSLLARRVHVESSDMLEVKVSGTISSIGDGNFLLEVANARAMSIPVSVTDDTRISDTQGNQLRFGDLAVGMNVDVKGHRSPNGAGLIASAVVVRREGAPIYVVGPIQRIGNSALVVAGILFETNANTEIVGSDGEPKTLDELKVGKLAKVSATRTAAGTLLALRIRELDALFGYVRIEGTIDETGDASLTLLGKEVRLLTQTRLATDIRPQPGAFARIDGELLAGGDVVALRVLVDEERSNDARVRGPVQRVADAGITVVGIRFQFTPTTRVEGPDGGEIEPSDIPIGAFAKVEGKEEADGTLIADRVRVRQRLIVRGPITSSDGHGFIVVGRRIELGEETVVLDAQNEPVAAATLTQGSTVEVEADEYGDGVIAMRVRLDNDGVVVSVDDTASEQPRGVSLYQNYPNPFNPTTTIVYEVKSIAAADVSVIIYDMLGRRVRNLFRGQVGAGVHTLSWNGLDDSGNEVASGAYLFRLQSDEFATSRQMLLLR